MSWVFQRFLDIFISYMQTFYRLSTDNIQTFVFHEFSEQSRSDFPGTLQTLQTFCRHNLWWFFTAKSHPTGIKTFLDILQQFSRHVCQQFFNKWSDWLKSRTRMCLQYISRWKIHSIKSKQTFVMKTSKMSATNGISVVVCNNFCIWMCVCVVILFWKGRNACINWLHCSILQRRRLKLSRWILVWLLIILSWFKIKTCCFLVRRGRVR